METHVWQTGAFLGVEGGHGNLPREVEQLKKAHPI